MKIVNSWQQCRMKMLLTAKMLWFNMLSYQMKVKKGLQLPCKPLSAFQIGKSKEA